MGAGRDGDKDTSTDSGGNFGNDNAADNNQNGGSDGNWGGASGWSGDMQDHLGAFGTTAGPMGYGRSSIGSLFDQLSTSMFGAPTQTFDTLSDFEAADLASSPSGLSQAAIDAAQAGAVNIDAWGNVTPNYAGALSTSLGALGGIFGGPGLGLMGNLRDAMNMSRAYSQAQRAGVAPSYSGGVQQPNTAFGANSSPLYYGG